MLFKYLSDAIRDQQELYKKVMPLNSIFLSRPVRLNSEKKSLFIRPGDKVRIERGELVDCLDDYPTHKIINCYGTMANTDFSIDVKDLRTGKQSNIKL
jgi:hypothetical protein